MKVPFFRTKKAKGAASDSEAAAPAAGALHGQLGELQAFLGQIDGFQGEAQRLFPENAALDQLLGELRDECQRRVAYMARVSARPAWMAPQSTSSTTLGARRGVLRGSPQSTSTVSTESDTDEAAWQQQPRMGDARRAGGGSQSASPPPSPARAAPRPSTVALRDRRRTAAPQSMFVLPGMPVDGSHAATVRARPKQPHRGSLAVAASDAPRLPRIRTSSVDAFMRPQSLADAGASMSTGDMGRLAAKSSTLGPARTPKPRPQQPQHMAAVKAAGSEYVVTVRLGGDKTEAAVSAGLQTSLVSMQLAMLKGLPVAKVPANSRVWSSGGKSWPVVGEVVAMPFACGNMTFTHSFKVVQGSAAANDLARDIVLGNDFFVGNKGRIKDNKLHLERGFTAISVHVREVSAA
ncbi:hypothetical protein H4S01_001273 [Coemansia sp. RSA 2610]|nr:hypothetical protein H4S01_001273 [Coemansia sp. RSA 2610]